MIGHRSDRISGTILHVINHTEDQLYGMNQDAHCFDSSDGKASFLFFEPEDCDEFLLKWEIDLTPNKKDLDMILKLTQ
jgi:hypothetical protein